MSSKRCPSCGETKPGHNFPKNRSQRDGLATYCKPCHNRIVKEHKVRLYGGHNVFLRKIRYGITEEQFQALYESQGGLCAICLEAPAEHADHAHDGTKNVRGLLCFNCNGALGKFNDDPDLIQAAIDYLDAFESKNELET